MRSNPGKTVVIHDSPGLVKAEQDVAITCRNIVSGLKNIGIFPFNHDTYTERDFVSAKVYKRPVTVKAANELNMFNANAEEKVISQIDQEANERA